MLKLFLSQLHPDCFASPRTFTAEPSLTASSSLHPQVTSTSLELHYWSLRPGLGSWVEGIVEGAAKLLHNLPHVDVKLLKGRADGTCDHEV